MLRKNSQKIKKLNEELEKNKQALENLKNSQAPQINTGDVQKIIQDALEAQKKQLEDKAKEVGAGPEDIMTLPNGMTIIKPKDPTKPPIFVMPDDQQKMIRDKLNITKCSLSSTSSISQSLPPKPNPMQQMMLGMLMQKNMRMMMGQDDESSKSSKSKSYSSTKSMSRMPMNYNPYQQYPPYPYQQFNPQPNLTISQPAVVQPALSLPPINQQQQEPPRKQSARPI